MMCPQEGHTALHLAAASGRDTVVEALLAANADVDANDKVLSCHLCLSIHPCAVAYPDGLADRVAARTPNTGRS